MRQKTCEKYKHWYEGITLTVKFILRGDNNPISTEIADLTLKRPFSKVSEREAQFPILLCHLFCWSSFQICSQREISEVDTY